MNRGVSVALVALGLMVGPQCGFAQSKSPVLIKPAVFGTVHEVTGTELPVVSAHASCPVGAQPLAEGPCFDTVRALLKTVPGSEIRVLGLTVPARPGDLVAGPYGRDYALFAVSSDGTSFRAHRLDLPTSQVTVPRDCYSLSGETVAYVLTDKQTAMESQLAICGGGPRQPQGPYHAEASSIVSGGTGNWHVTETIRNQGQIRYLAYPDSTCDPQYSLRSSYCARPAVTYLQTHLDVAELDLIAAKHPVIAGDSLTPKELDQWVLKRKSDKGFKADGRWFAKSLMASVDGCRAVEDIHWLVQGQVDGLYIAEQALNTCGAPLAPIPSETWEAYGDDLFIVDCADHHWDRKDHLNGGDGGCMTQADDYLRKSRLSSATVVVLNERGRLDDHLYEGGYLSYDVVEVRLDKDGALGIRRLDDYSPSVFMSRCTALSGGPKESKGFVLVRSLGVTWARGYQWMSCPVY